MIKSSRLFYRCTQLNTMNDPLWVGSIVPTGLNPNYHLYPALRAGLLPSSLRDSIQITISTQHFVLGYCPSSLRDSIQITISTQHFVLVYCPSSLRDSIQITISTQHFVLGDCPSSLRDSIQITISTQHFVLVYCPSSLRGTQSKLPSLPSTSCWSIAHRPYGVNPNYHLYPALRAGLLPIVPTGLNPNYHLYPALRAGLLPIVPTDSIQITISTQHFVLGYCPSSLRDSTGRQGIQGREKWELLGQPDFCVPSSIKTTVGSNPGS